jgi:hypothetical protein
MKCPSCGAELPYELAYCPECGQPTKPAEPQSVSQPDESPYARSVVHATKTPPQNPTTPMGLFAFAGMWLLLLIPVVNVFLLFRWAFHKRININKRNCARALLLLWVLGLALFVTLGILFPGLYAPLWQLLGALFVVG